MPVTHKKVICQHAKNCPSCPFPLVQPSSDTTPSTPWRRGSIYSGRERRRYNTCVSVYGIRASMPNSRPPATPTNEKLAGVSPVRSRPLSAASPVLPSYHVGRGISLPFGRLLPECYRCSCNALIAWSLPFDPKECSGICLNHSLQDNSAIRDLVKDVPFYRYSFISPEHEAAIRAFLNLSVVVETVT